MAFQLMHVRLLKMTSINKIKHRSIQFVWLERLITLLLIILLGTSMASCEADTPTKHWQEEVKLLDGRVITVKQKLRYERLTPRESWITVNLPETGNQDVTWNERLTPKVLNVINGKLYIVGMPITEIEFYWYHKPSPPYIGFIYDNKAWRQIPFKEIPVEIYDMNLSFRIRDYNWPAPITPAVLTEADQAKDWADPRLSLLNKDFFKRINPKARAPDEEKLQADRNNKSLLSPNKIY